MRAAGGSGWAGEGGQNDRHLAGSQSQGCALLLQAPQCPGSHLINLFPEMLLAFGGSCISMSRSSACRAIPQSALQLLKSALSRGGGRSHANKNNFPASARAESGSAVRRDPQRGLASARRVLLPGGLKISMRYRLPGGCISSGWHLKGLSPACSSLTGAGAKQVLIIFSTALFGGTLGGLSVPWGQQHMAFVAPLLPPVSPLAFPPHRQPLLTSPWLFAATCSPCSNGWRWRNGHGMQQRKTSRRSWGSAELPWR